MPSRSAYDMGHSLELPRHHIRMFMGFNPPQYSWPQRIFLENLPPSSGTHVLGCIRSGDDNHLGAKTVVGRSSFRKALQRWLNVSNLSTNTNHKILMLDRGWTKTHGHFIQMGGFMLFEGDNPRGVLTPSSFSELLTAGKIEFPTVTVEEIEDRSKADGFSKTIALGQTLWFVVQCIARRAQHLDLTLVELLTLSLAILNGLMYFLWWNKPMDVRCPVRVYLVDNTPNMPDMSESEIGRFGEFQVY